MVAKSDGGLSSLLMLAGPSGALLRKWTGAMKRRSTFYPKSSKAIHFNMTSAFDAGVTPNCSHENCFDVGPHVIS